MIRKMLETPWKIKIELLRFLYYPYIRCQFYINKIPWGYGWKIYGTPIIQKHRDSRVSIGNRLSLRSIRDSNPLGINHELILCTWKDGAIIEIGDNFSMSGGSIVAAELIRIGDRVTIGANTTIIDTDFHPLDPIDRRMKPQNGKTAPVIIEDDVFIGVNCIILKGVHIGRGSVIGAGSVVTKNVPERKIIAGNPSRIIGEL